MREFVRTADRRPIGQAATDRKATGEARRNCRLLILNGGVMFMAMAFASSDLVLPAFVQTLTTSSIMIGLAGSLMRVGWSWPQVFISRVVESRARKMPLFVWAGVGRSSLWFAAGVLTFVLGDRNPALCFSTPRPPR